MLKNVKWLILMLIFVSASPLAYGAGSILDSTNVILGLNKMLNRSGTFDIIYMADGTSFSTAPISGGDVVGPSSSVDSEVAIYNSTTGKLLKRFAGTGIVTATSGVIGTATTTGTGAVVLATSPTVQTPTVSDGAIFNLLSNNNITIDASTNPRTVTTGVVRINHTPGMVGTRPFTLNIDAAGFGDTHAVSTDFTATGIGAGEQNHLFDINVNTANSTGGEVNGLTMAKTGTGAVDCNAVEVYPGVNVITQRTGTETSIEQAFSYNGAYTDITSNLSSTASDVQLFVANGDIVYIGNAGTYNSLAVTLAVAASGAGIKPTFEYSAGASAWTAFSPTDGTNGFRNLGGTIAWGTLTGWATDTVNAVGSKYWVRITRTQNTLATPPTEDVIKYIASINYGWDKDGDILAATLGVGTTTPATALHVIGTTTTTAATIGGVVSVLALDGTAFVDTTTNPGLNAGTGIVTYSGVETIVKYEASSSFVVPEGVTSLKVLVVGGGAGGDGGISAAVYGHGGGGGRVTYRSAFSVTPGSSHIVTIGAGGALGAMDAQASPGGQSVFGSVTAAGGVQANNIGSGGDGGDSGNDIDSVVTNYNGLTDSTWGAAGGAGAGGVGGTVTDAAGGTGGAGYSSSITGSATAYGAGGNGSGTGTGAPSIVDANLGLGGHGHGTSMRAGGSGVVIVRFITTYDQLRVNDKFQIDNGGKVSIGGVVANNSLTVANPGVNGVAIDLRSDDTDLTGVNDFSVARLLADFTSGSYVDSRLHLQTATGDNTWKTGLTIKDGFVGIGTSTPSDDLWVSSNNTANIVIEGDANNSGNDGGYTGLSIWDQGSEIWYVGRDGTTPSDKLIFRRSGVTNDMVINTSGNVGIGEVSPGSKLSVSGGGSFGAAYDTTAAPTNGLIVEGNVGIGVTSPKSLLNIQGDSNDARQLIVNSNTSSGKELYLGWDENGDYGAIQTFEQGVGVKNLVLQQVGGNVGVGASTPSAQLHTTGTVRFQNFGAGAANFDAAGNVSSSSDERLKNVAGEFTVGLNQLLGINPIQYRWNALSGLEKDNLYTGFSAQNVRKFVPEAVSVDAKGYYNLQDRVLIAALVNTVKQLTAEIDELRSTVGLAPKSRIGTDRQTDSASVVKSKIAQAEKECGVDEVVKETKEVVENIDGIEVVKTVEVLKAGIVEKDKKFYRQENIEEATQRYRLTSQEPQEVVK